jgi:hypothetical protein
MYSVLAGFRLFGSGNTRVSFWELAGIVSLAVEAGLVSISVAFLWKVTSRYRRARLRIG